MVSVKMSLKCNVSTLHQTEEMYEEPYKIIRKESG